MPKIITIGDAAKMFGLSPQALRYYQKMGVAVPHLIGENGYRYYPIVDIIALCKAKYLQSMGFSLSDIRDELDRGIIIEERLTALDDQCKVLMDEIKKAEIVLGEIVKYKEQIKKVKDQFRAYETVTSPPLFFLALNEENTEVSKETGLIEEIKKWVDLFPLTQYAFIYSKESLMNFPENCYGVSGLVISADIADQFGIKENNVVQYLPARRCVYTVTRAPMGGRSSLAMLKGAADYLDSQGLEPIDDAFGIYIVSLKEEDRLKYYKIWIPIEESAKDEG